MRQVLVRQGRAEVESVPAPVAEPGAVLVRVSHSCISVGTEMSGVRSSGRPLWQRALERPEQVRRVLEMASEQGLAATRAAIAGKLQAGTPTGYSAAGTVVEVGAGVEDLRPGDRVACAGAQYAFHAELVRVPRNLVVRVPDGLDTADASTVTLGAIALQGVRRATPTLGETFVVVGLGILGQLTTQLLAANGCRVIGTDLDRERIALALRMGMHLGVHPEDGAEAAQVERLTAGVGADGVIIAAATPSNDVMSTAFRMCRRKGRVVLVGDVGLDLDREDFYRKEIDFFISTSYGPGRYDERYEEHGLDYPVGYVRWTENRNMEEYLRLLTEERISVGPLVSATYPLERADEAYAALGGESKPLMVLLSYPQDDTPPERRVPNPRVRPDAGAGRLRLAVVGAGGFARGMHLPNLRTLGDLYVLRAVVSRSGHNAAASAAEFGAAYSSTDYEAVLADPEVDAVLIATRHHLHAPMLLAALRAGKHVLVEKPLALTREEMREVSAFFADREGEAPVLLTGFNRRFSPFARRAEELLRGRSAPLLAQYRMNAGYLPTDHWVHGPEGGGRNRGEACHIYDLFTFLTGARAVAVRAEALRPQGGYYLASDNFVATVGFDDGSLATLTYTALGASDLPKERMELFFDGKVLVLDDYLRLKVHGARAAGVVTKSQDKGQKEELRAFADAALRGGEWPIPLWQQLQATEIALAVEEAL